MTKYVHSYFNNYFFRQSGNCIFCFNSTNDTLSFDAKFEHRGLYQPRMLIPEKNMIKPQDQRAFDLLNNVDENRKFN